MNYTELRQALIDYAENNDPEFAAHIDDFFKAGELRIFREADLRAFREQAQTQITRSDPFLLLPTTAVIVRSLHIKDSSNRRVLLLPKNYTFLTDFWPDRSREGVPRYYAHWKEQVLFMAPTPNQDFYTEMEYSVLPESIVTAGTSWLGDNAWTALLYAALIEAYGFMKGEAQAIATGAQPGLWPQKYQEALQQLGVQEVRERVDDFRARDPR